MGNTGTNIPLTLTLENKDIKANLAAIGESVKKLGLMTESAFAKRDGMGVLGVKNFAEVKAEMAKLTTAYRGLAASGKLSAGEQAKALEALRAKQRDLYATISNPPKLDLARSVLGISSQQSIVAEINKVKQAYASLASSGKANLAELTRAKVAMGQKIDELKKKTNDWRDALGQIKGRALEAGAAGAGIVLASKAAIDFESAMADVRKVVDGTPEEISALGKSLQDLSERIPLTAIELAAIATAGGQLGIAAKDILPFVEVTAKMATAFDMTAEEAGNAIGKLKNVFQLSIQEIAQFGDAINQLGNTSAAREKDIVDVLLRVGGTAKQFGLAKEQTAALAAAFLSLGKGPEVASTGINAMLNRMQTATMQAPPFAEALKKIGMTAEEMADAVATNPQKALDDLLETLSKLEGREKAEVLTGLFGAEYQDDIAVLVGSLQTYRDTMKQVADANAFAGAMQKEFEARAATTKNQLILLKNEFVRIVTNVGTGFLPIIKQGAIVLTGMLKPIADLTGMFPRLSAGIVGLATGAIVFSTIAKAVGIMKSAFTIFGVDAVASLGKVGTAGRGLGLFFSTFVKRYLAPFLIGWEIGTWLNQFDTVQRAGIAMASALTKSWLGARLAWSDLTGGDSEAILKEIREADQIYGEMFANVGKDAKETAAVQKKAQQEIATATEQSVNTQKKVTGAALDEMKKKYQEFTAEVKRLQGEIVSEQVSADQQIRDLNRQTMSEKDAWEDKKKQAQEYATVAKAAGETGKLALKAATEAGDEAGRKAAFADAKEAFAVQAEYAGMARQMYAELVGEVKNGDKVIMTQKQTIEVATAGIKASAEAKIAALKGMQEAEYAAMEELTRKSGLQDLSKGMDEAEEKWLKNWQDMRAAAISDIEAVEDRLLKIKDREITVWINEKERKATGGAIGALRMAGGGAVQAFRNMLSGGHFPGFGGGDRRHVVAEDGEYMLDKHRVRDAGLPVVRAFHAGDYGFVVSELLKKMKGTISRQVGGIIDRMPTLPPIGPQFMQAGGQVAAGGGGGDTFNFSFHYSGSQPSAREQARQVLIEFKKMYKGQL